MEQESKPGCTRLKKNLTNAIAVIILRAEIVKFEKKDKSKRYGRKVNLIFRHKTIFVCHFMSCRAVVKSEWKKMIKKAK